MMNSGLLRRDQFHGYQVRTVEHLLSSPYSMLFQEMGLGKAQPDSEPVLTPAGFVTMGSLYTGDEVIGSDGLPTEIIAVYPQGLRPVFTVSFSDGSNCRCDAEHLWTVRRVQNRDKTAWRTLSTQDMISMGVKHKNGNAIWKIPVTDPIVLPNKDLPIDPYLLGIILGDGSINKYDTVTITSDTSILRDFDGVLMDHYSEGVSSLRITYLKKQLSSLGLTHKRSHEKFVPDMYWSGSVDQRLSVLQGLMDSDGYAMPDGGAEFCSTSPHLIEAVVHITQSLGGVARRGKTKLAPRFQTGIGKVAYRLNIKLPAELPPFRVLRKLNTWVPPSKYPPTRNIHSITFDGFEESTCIEVAADHHEYLTKDCIVTHNTISTLTAISDLFDTMALSGVLIVAPKRVCELVWEQEARKWEHVSWLRFSKILGPEKKRIAAIYRPAQIYLINYENLVWLQAYLETAFLRQGKYLPFDMIVFDEISKMKNTRTRQGAERGRAALKMLPYIPRRIGLTGTPASNGLLDLFGQFLIIDSGTRLGRSHEDYKRKYFYQSDYSGYRYDPFPTAKTDIGNLIGDITISMKSEDYLNMPPKLFNDVMITMPPGLQKEYDAIESDMMVQLTSGAQVEVFNAASLINRTLQFANGAIYTNPGEPEWESIHALKLEALEEIVEEAAGEPILVAFAFQHDAHKIMKKFKDAVWFNAKMSETDAAKAVDDFEAGRLRLLIAHPGSAGHGLDRLQNGGHIVVWYGLNWSLDLYDQTNARLWRQGQKRPVIVHRILVDNTTDLAVRDALNRKAQDESSIKQAVMDYWKGKHNGV